LACLA